MINAMPSTHVNNLATTEVTGALEAILNTDKFMASPQMSAFLRYVVEQTLIGNTRRIKAFTVGIEALGKPASFDPQTDPSVRVLAKRLRSSLDTYYTQNPETDVFIEMKPGSYVPKFLRRSEMPVEMPVSNTSSQYPVQTAAEAAEAAMLGQPAVTAAPMQSNDTTAAMSTTREESQTPKLDTSVGHNHAAHLSVQQQNALSNRAESETTEAVNTEDRNDRKSSISQLWQAYKSASKVA